ncbi:MAG TPA: hypothetical protein VFT50_18640 [Baekduia sp.]|nr:hypothetical protein [Baekduia sp.]
MSETPHASDIEIARALNALTVTLNDQKATTADPRRWQEIVTGSLGGEERLRALVDDAAPGVAGRLEDARTGERRATFRYRDGRWTSTREGAPLSGGYIPG